MLCSLSRSECTLSRRIHFLDLTVRPSALEGQRTVREHRLKMPMYNLLVVMLVRLGDVRAATNASRLRSGVLTLVLTCGPSPRRRATQLPRGAGARQRWSLGCVRISA